jgi:hypothetical protein
MFRGALDGAFETEPKGKGGRPPFYKLMIFRVLDVQGLCTAVRASLQVKPSLDKIFIEKLAPNRFFFFTIVKYYHSQTLNDMEADLNNALITNRHCPSAVCCATPLFYTLIVLPMRKS